jgi:hypothetical protein
MIYFRSEASIRSYSSRLSEGKKRNIAEILGQELVPTAPPAIRHRPDSSGPQLVIMGLSLALAPIVWGLTLALVTVLWGLSLALVTVMWGLALVTVMWGLSLALVTILWSLSLALATVLCGLRMLPVP